MLSHKMIVDVMNMHMAHFGQETEKQTSLKTVKIMHLFRYPTTCEM